MKQTLGVAVMRMQVAAPTKGHLHLLRTMIANHSAAQLYLGDRSKNLGKQNPLPWQARAQMVKSHFPDLQVDVLWDHPSNDVWSATLDQTIKDRWPDHEVTLYCSRDGFVSAYSGEFPVVEVAAVPSSSGTEERQAIHERGPVADELFRQGMVYAAMQQHTTIYSTVDVAILSTDRQQLLLGQKKDDCGKWRFIGGFVDPKDSTRLAAAKRETREEVGMIEIDWVGHIDSLRVNDWRYRDEPDGIMTDLFLGIYLFGKPQAVDDLDDVAWFPIESYREHLIDAHQPLAERLAPELTKH